MRSTVFLLPLLLIVYHDCVHCCVPQRELSNGVRENPTIVSGRPLTTFLQYKQFHPNVDENSDDASGKRGKPMLRRSKKWKQTMRYYQTSDEVVFQDEEKGKRHGKRTYEDHWMTQRCYAALDRLALSLRLSPPGQDFGVRILVLDAWEPIRRRTKAVRTMSLHHEGRALDLAFYVPRVHRKVWKAESKLGLLAFWAIRAGFDWVHYENREYIHVSCRADRPGEVPPIPLRCFPENAVVSLENSHSKIMADLQIGDRILTINSDGNIVASPIILFLDRSVNVVDQYVLVTLTDNQELRMSPDHLIFRLKNRQSFKSDADHRALKLLWNSGNVSHEMRHITGNDSGHFKTPRPLRLGYFNDHRFEPPDVSSTTGLWSLTEATLAKNLQRGDFVLQRDADNDHLLWVKVTAIGKIYDRGAYAPLTAEGTLLVNGVVASCYAATRHEKLAHFSMAPIRWLSYLTTFERSSGLHFYAKLLMNIADVIEMFSAIQLYN